jgi:oligopeptide transport system substrate-binding protein
VIISLSITELPRLSLALLAGALLCSACGPDGEQNGLRREKRSVPVELVMIDGRPDPAVLAAAQVLMRGNGEEPQTLDPHLAEGVPSSHILRDLFEGLTTEAPNGKVVPGAAVRWNISRDQLTYTFYLRRDAVWSNGDPVTAQDFVYSFRRSADPETASNFANVLSPIVNAQQVLRGELPTSELGVSSLDEFTLQIMLESPTPYFLKLLGHSSTYPVHQGNVEEHGSRFSRPGNLVSNGAYVLADWQVRSNITLEKNPLYRDAENVILDKVVFVPIEDQSTEIKQFRSGELDWTYEVPNNQFDWLATHYPEELVISPWLGSYFFGINLKVEPFINNPALRQALVLAIDREVMTGKVTRFGEKPSFTLVPPGIGEYEPPVPEWASWTQAEREEQARRLFEQAGYSPDNPPRIEIRYNTSENHKKIALAMGSMWKQVLGINTTLVNEEWKVFLQNRNARVITQVFRAGWISDYSDPFGFLELFKSDSGLNDFGFSNSSFDALLEEISGEHVPARRNRMMQEAERILLAESPIIPVYTYVTKRLVDPHIKGWQNNVMDHHYSRYMYKLRSKPKSGDASPSDLAETVQSETAVDS